MKNMLQWWCEEYDLLPRSRVLEKEHLVYDNLTNMTLHIKYAFSNKKLLAAFLDVFGAVVNVNS